jgi:polyhydroxyalkanoate synthesis regulator phasin
MEADKGTVGRDELQKRLVATGMFTREDALAIIDEMVRIKKIQIVMINTYRKSHIKEDASQ